MLQHGEVLPEDVDVDEVMSNSENEELKDIEMQVNEQKQLLKLVTRTPAADTANDRRPGV